MIKPIPQDHNPKPVMPNPPPPPPKNTEPPKKVDNSRFEGAVSQAAALNQGAPKIKLNLSQPAPPVIEPKEKGTNLNKIL